MTKNQEKTAALDVESTHRLGVENTKCWDCGKISKPVKIITAYRYEKVCRYCGAILGLMTEKETLLAIQCENAEKEALQLY